MYFLSCLANTENLGVLGQTVRQLAVHVFTVQMDHLTFLLINYHYPRSANLESDCVGVAKYCACSVQLFTDPNK